MKASTDRTERRPPGIAGLFSDAERKELFRKYLMFLGWVEIFILLACWFYQTGNQGYDRYGPIEIAFPWKAYFLLAFLAPVAITFLVGIVIVAFNKYIDVPASEGEDAPGALMANRTQGFQRLHHLLNWLQHVPFLGLLLLLGVSAALFYRLDDILTFFATVGEQSGKIALASVGILICLAVAFGLILIFLNYRLRKASMEYQYKTEVAEKFGLVILDDNTVLNSQGKLLVRGKKFKGVAPLLGENAPGSDSEEGGSSSSTGNLPARTVDLETSS